MHLILTLLFDWTPNRTCYLQVDSPPFPFTQRAHENGPRPQSMGIFSSTDAAPSAERLYLFCLFLTCLSLSQLPRAPDIHLVLFSLVRSPSHSSHIAESLDSAPQPKMIVPIRKANVGSTRRRGAAATNMVIERKRGKDTRPSAEGAALTKAEHPCSGTSCTNRNRGRHRWVCPVCEIKIK